MVDIELEYSLTSGETFMLRGRVRNVGDVATPTLLCELGDGDSEIRCTSRLKLRQLPAIPLPLCIAQAIQSAANAKPGSQADLRNSLERACIKLLIGGEERLDFVLWRMYDELEDETGMLPAWGRAAMTPWRLGHRMLERAANAWPSSALLSMPSAMASEGSEGYCRTADLPGPLRVLFARQYCLAPQPLIEGVPDAFFASDFARFLSTFGRDSTLETSQPLNSVEPLEGGPDLALAMRKLHELGLADGDVGFSYWNDVAQLLQAAKSARERVDELERQLSLAVRAKNTSGPQGRASRRR